MAKGFETMFSDMTRNGQWLIRAATIGLLAGSLAACSTIPSSGPTGSQVVSDIAADTGDLGIALIEVQSVGDLPPPSAPPAVFAPAYVPPPPTELVGPGEMLDIAIYETGITLFSSSGAASAGAAGLTANAERLPPTRVSDQGTINIPYLGELPVSGRTTNEIEQLIRRALRGKSQNPQVLVSIREGLINSVIIGGDVNRPGRIVLPTNRETLSDIIALAGGSRGEIRDMLVRVQRGEDRYEIRLGELLADPARDLRIFPADRIAIVRSPRSFSVLGAAGRTEQIGFPDEAVSLAQAIALAGGTNPNTGDPRAVFVFRQNQAPEDNQEPVVYHFNMMHASSFLLAQRFAMNDDDILYIGNAEANQPTKLVQIVSQLFLPLLTIQNAFSNN
jgi:polysaccharide export outer membrane protein